MARRPLKLVAYLVALILVSGGSAAAASFSNLKVIRDGHTLAQAANGSIYQASSTSIGAEAPFRDSRADGHGVYFEGHFQAWDKITAPRCCRYYTWSWSRSKQTARYGTADGWRQGAVRTGDAAVTRWRGLAKVCVDRSWRPDPCAATGYRYPFG